MPGTVRLAQKAQRGGARLSVTGHSGRKCSRVLPSPQRYTDDATCAKLSLPHGKALRTGDGWPAGVNPRARRAHDEVELAEALVP